jgi:hypothetical protein
MKKTENEKKKLKRKLHSGKVGPCSYVRELRDIEECLVYDAGNNTLTITLSHPYEVDLDRITEPEHLLDWLSQLSRKSWMTTKVMGCFLRRVRDLKGWKALM